MLKIIMILFNPDFNRVEKPQKKEVVNNEKISLLPDLKCQSCGNYEISDFNNAVGHCLRFCMVVDGSEVNAKCWQLEKSQYYKNLFELAEKQKSKKEAIQAQKAKQLNLF
ncbi:hypothetical protein [Flavobacterium sp. XGLA_31]|uniref:hypothetical protein n=1 Tax=Flavobacterium sp. XGLA_31 TaxID=3447666 RepID=UPI003F362739